MQTISRFCYAFALAALLRPIAMPAQTDLPPGDPHQQGRQSLLKILTAVEAAINAQDIEGMIAQMSPDCTVTWWNAEISRGHDEIRAYYRKMVKDDGRLINKYTTQSKIGGHARFIGSGSDVALAEGSMEDEFFPVIRGSFKLNSRWSSTVAKSATGEWKIASLHLSSNVFTNSLMAEMARMIYIAAAVALLIGAIAGWFFGRRSAK